MTAAAEPQLVLACGFYCGAAAAGELLFAPMPACRGVVEMAAAAQGAPYIALMVPDGELRHRITAAIAREAVAWAAEHPERFLPGGER